MRRARRSASRRGAALLELAVSLPLFVLIISGTYYFFHRSEERLAAQLAARYSAWHAANGSGRGASSAELAEAFPELGRGDLQVMGDGCSQSVEGRLGTGADAGRDSVCGQSGAGPSLGNLGEVVGDFFRNKGISFALHGRTVRLTRESNFLAPGGARRSVAGVCWVHDNYVPGAGLSDGEVEGTFDIDLTSAAMRP